MIKKKARDIGHQIEREGKNKIQTNFRWKMS
jgi:hypothetical protein